MKQPTAEKNGSISIWGDKGRKREKNTRICTIKLILPHFRHLQISKKRDKCSDCFSHKKGRVYNSVLCKVEEVRTRNYNLEQWRAKIPSRARKRTHAYAYRRTYHRSFVFLLSQVSHCTFTNAFMMTKIRHLLTPKNDTSVEEKRRVIFNKTTYRFQQNNVSFSIKQRIVSRKTSRRDYDDIAPFRFKANNFHGSPSV